MPSARPKRESGAATVIHAGFIEDLDLNPEVRGDLWYGNGFKLGKAQEMMRDPHVRKSVEAIVDPILSAAWDFEPASKDAIDVEIAQFCKWALIEQIDFERVLDLGTTGYVRDGFALFEQTDDVRPKPKNRFPSLGPNVVVPTGFHHIPAWSVERWWQNTTDPDQLGGIKQFVAGSDAEKMSYRDVSIEESGDLLLRLTWQQEGADFTGMAALRSAWGAFKTKRIIKTIAMIRHQREGAGIPELTYPESPTVKEKQAGAEILKKMMVHEQGYLELPNGFTFRFATTNGQSTGLMEAEEQCNRDIAYNLGVAWMLLGISGKTGSWALADTQKGHYLLSLEKHARFWARTFNHGRDGWSPVERIVRLNYGPDVSLPRLIARDMPTREWHQILSLLPSLIKAGAVRIDQPLRSMLRGIMRFGPEDEATLEETPKPEPAGAFGDKEEREEERAERQEYFNLSRENADGIKQLFERLDRIERGTKLSQDALRKEDARARRHKQQQEEETNA